MRRALEVWGNPLVSTSPDSKAIRNPWAAFAREPPATWCVSTSPDSKAIRNVVKTFGEAMDSAEFQLPRIAKPSGTGLQRLLHPPPRVSTSPDSKAIRNVVTGSLVGSVGGAVSTSPDSKAIRNLVAGSSLAWDETG